MNPLIRNILAVLAGWIIGSAANMSLIKIGFMVTPIEGIDPNDMEALAEVMPTLGYKHFIFPFLAHALGTLVGATIAAFIATKHKMNYALGIGFIFLLGGIAASFMLPAPTWFIIFDLVLAYIPMAWLGGKIAARKSPGFGDAN
jgi:hypothetical protein